MLVEAFFLVNLLSKEPSDAAFPTLRHCQEVSVKLTGKWKCSRRSVEDDDSRFEWVGCGGGVIYQKANGHVLTGKCQGGVYRTYSACKQNVDKLHIQYPTFTKWCGRSPAL
jgi:hypothetical protein